MDDSFKVRVDKSFGSLSSSSSSSSQTLASSSLWCLTDEEIDKRQWSRDPCTPAAAEDDVVAASGDSDNGAFSPLNVDKFLFDKAMESVLSPNPNDLASGAEINEKSSDLGNEGGEGTSERSSVSRCGEGVGDDEDDQLDVRNSIGMDGTLDFEEEEDEYDKVAVGSEKIGHRLYMSDVTDYTSPISSYNELPDTFRETTRDPRANHLAAKLRLKEDAETARSFDSLHVSDQTKDDVSGAHDNTREDGNLLKSILKRKDDDQMDSKTGKRVRFEPVCKRNDHITSGRDNKIVVSEASNVDNISFKESLLQQRDSSLVPDYISHPLRYTHYTFDTSDDMNEECNRQAYMDFLNMVKKSKSEPEEAPADLTKPVIFTPKKKAGDASSITSNKIDHEVEEPVQKKSFPLIIAAGNTEENESSEMEVDEQETASPKVGNGNRTARKYRSKLTTKSNEPDA